RTAQRLHHFDGPNAAAISNELVPERVRKREPMVLWRKIHRVSLKCLGASYSTISKRVPSYQVKITGSSSNSLNQANRLAPDPENRQQQYDTAGQNGVAP